MASLRNVAAPYWAEFIGSLLLTLVGLGATAQSLVAPANTPALSSSLAWGSAVTLGIWVSEHVSGGHINPAITLARALFSDFSLAKVPGYLAAQTLGAFSGALLVWLNFASDLGALKPTHGLHPATHAFITANDTWSGLVNEITASFIFVLAVFAISDQTSNAKNIAPLALGVAFAAASLALSSPLQLALNPARDFGPRVFAALVYGLDVFADHSFYFWVPIVGPIAGAVLGAFVYEWLVRRDAEYQHSLEDA